MPGLFLILVWVGFVRVVIKTDWWGLCTGLYAGSVFFLTLAWGLPLYLAALLAASMGTLAGLHFWLLVRFDLPGVWYLILVILGFLLVHCPLVLV